MECMSRNGSDVVKVMCGQSDVVKVMCGQSDVVKVIPVIWSLGNADLPPPHAKFGPPSGGL